MSTQLPLQAAWPAAQPQAPFWHASPLAQALPHAPQLAASVLKLRHCPAHSARGAAQAPPAALVPALLVPAVVVVPPLVEPPPVVEPPFEEPPMLEAPDTLVAPAPPPSLGDELVQAADPASASKTAATPRSNA